MGPEMFVVGRKMGWELSWIGRADSRRKLPRPSWDDKVLQLCAAEVMV